MNSTLNIFIGNNLSYDPSNKSSGQEVLNSFSGPKSKTTIDLLLACGGSQLESPCFLF